MYSTKLKKRLEITEKIIDDALAKYKDKIGLAWSTGKDSTTLLHLVIQRKPDIEVFSLFEPDFNESIEFRDKLWKEWNLNLKIIQSKKLKELQKEWNLPGSKVFERLIKNKFLCCYTIKVLALRDNCAHLDALFAGIRRTECEWRKNIDHIETGDYIPKVRIHPMADWEEDEIWEYLDVNKVPHNEAYDKGYRSVGCAPCTLPTGLLENGRRAKKKKEEKYAERKGRTREDIKVMHKLRKLGYF